MRLAPTADLSDPIRPKLSSAIIEQAKAAMQFLLESRRTRQTKHGVVHADMQEIHICWQRRLMSGRVGELA